MGRGGPVVVHVEGDEAKHSDVPIDLPTRKDSLGPFDVLETSNRREYSLSSNWRNSAHQKRQLRRYRPESIPVVQLVRKQ